MIEVLRSEKFLKLQDLQQSAVTAGALAVDEVEPLVLDRG
jgi:hypothetical protein